MYQKRLLCSCLVVAGALILSAWRRPGEPLKPSGLNFFSKDQDIQLGKEAATEVRKQVTVVQNQFLQDYIQHIGKRLTSQPEAGDWPFNFTVILDPNINAFALPGGPMFVNSGTIANAENEAQIAGVMGHEMSHVILRHGTKQASKANLLQIPAMLAGAVVGDGSLLGELTKLGIGVGANSILLKYSRDDESQADAMGTHLMAEAGYNPVELAHFFQKLEAQGGSRPLQFLSDHPNPGNREEAIQAEIQTLPKRQYAYQTGDFDRAKAEVVKLPKPAPKPSGAAAADPAAARPSGKLQPFQGRSFSFSYPSNWQVFGDQNSDSITMAAREGIVQGASGGAQVGYGVMASYFSPDEQGQSLSQATDDLVQHLHASNPSMKTTHSSRKTKVDGKPALITMLSSSSPLPGAGEETDALLTVARPQGLFYLVFIAPSGEFKSVESVFNEVVGSVRFQ